MSDHSTGRPVPARVLQLVVFLRLFAVAAQLTTVLLVTVWLGIPLPLPLMGLVLGVQLAASVLTLRNLRRQRYYQEITVFLHLAFDAVLLGVMLGLAGGYTNPFISLFLVPIALAASFLKISYGIAMLVLCSALYSVLIYLYLPLTPPTDHFIDIYTLHLAGMWVSFLLSAVLTTAFVGILSRIAREREESLARARETMLQNEHLLLMGTLSAGVLHEINTPLASIRMLLDEMEQSPPGDPWVQEQIPLLREQTGQCIERIRELSETGKPLTAETPLSLADFRRRTLQRWAAMRPEINIREAHGADEGFLIQHPQALAQVLVNLLNNAADASLENGQSQICISFTTQDTQLTIDIDDRGNGLPPHLHDQVGALIRSDKKNGLGVGLMLSHATLEQIGGTLVLRDTPNGTRATVRLSQHASS
ncbi:ATP-binding protein [Granulosicoccaceae sp. 1_MG-2023]|nr:ATP-binding protein [Granulosicoccaceae sp. 1_MG-2023]